MSEAIHLVGETWRNMTTKHYEHGRWDLEQFAFVCEMLGLFCSEQAVIVGG